MSDKKTPTEKLDLVLMSFKAESDRLGYHKMQLRDTLKINRLEIDERILNEILHKLVNDKYLRKESVEEVEYNARLYHHVPLYVLTFEGELFQQAGGYTEQAKSISTSNRYEYIQTLILTYGTGFAGLYGVFEIAKWFFHHEHWVLPF